MKYRRALIALVYLAFSSSALAELKTYEVDAMYRQEVFQALRRVLSPERTSSAVEMLPTGQLLIDTSPEMHEQVAAVLRAISEHQAEQTPRVTLQYWVVLGTSDPAAAGDTPQVLADVLDEIRQIHGPLSFRVLGNASLVTESGRDGRIDGELQINQRAYVQGTTLNASLQISSEYSVATGAFAGTEQINPFQTVQRESRGVQLDTSMERGEFVVVGENTIRNIVAGDGPVDGTAFYIVHWPNE